jgi:hypothetical protein
LAKLDKVAVVLIIDFDNAPRVLAATDMATIGCLDHLVRSDNGKWDLALLYCTSSHKAMLIGRTMATITATLLARQKGIKAHYHNILGLVDGLNIVRVVVLSVVDLDVVMGNVQQDLK